MFIPLHFKLNSELDDLAWWQFEVSGCGSGDPGEKDKHFLPPDSHLARTVGQQQFATLVEGDLVGFKFGLLLQGDTEVVKNLG